MYEDLEESYTYNRLKRIVDGEWQVVILSPEMLQSKPFIGQVLRDSKFTRRLLSVVIDEAHVVSHWGSEFRKKYGELGRIRAFLQPQTSVVALSATLPDRVRSDVLNKLQFSKSGYLDINVGNDRPNVSLVVRAMQYPMNTYADLDFVVPTNTACAEDVPKTFIYADNINTGTEIIDHLLELLPESLREAGLIRSYNAACSDEYRDEAMRLFRDGAIRVLVCTDAAGMVRLHGCMNQTRISLFLGL